MKFFMCLALLAMIAVAAAVDIKDEPIKKKDPKDGKVSRDGRYLLVENRGLYDNVYKSYVVYGSPLYTRYVDNVKYYTYTYPSSSYYYSY